MPLPSANYVPGGFVNSNTINIDYEGVINLARMLGFKTPADKEAEAKQNIAAQGFADIFYPAVSKNTQQELANIGAPKMEDYATVSDWQVASDKFNQAAKAVEQAQMQNAAVANMAKNTPASSFAELGKILMASKAPMKQDLVKASPGEAIYDPNKGRVVFTNPKEQEKAYKIGQMVTMFRNGEEGQAPVIGYNADNTPIYGDFQKKPSDFWMDIGGGIQENAATHEKRKYADIDKQRENNLKESKNYDELRVQFTKEAPIVALNAIGSWGAQLPEAKKAHETIGANGRPIMDNMTYDTMLIKAFSKITDPTTGVLTGEGQAILNQMGFGDRIIAVINRALSSGSLTDETRKSLFDAAIKMNDVATKSAKEIVDSYKRVLEKRGASKGEVDYITYLPYQIKSAENMAKEMQNKSTAELNKIAGF